METYSKLCYYFKGCNIQRLADLCIDDDTIEPFVEKSGELSSVKLMFAGRLIARKGVEFLLDVVEKLVGMTDQEFTVNIFGDGPQRKFLEQKSHKLKLEDRVIFHGAINREKLLEEYKKYDVYVHPSIRESGGTAVYEAMSNGLPICGLSQNWVYESVSDKAGILVPIEGSLQDIQTNYAKELCKLIKNKPLRTELGKNARKIIKENYTWQLRVKFMFEQYKKII
jgi:glycosyltransferase involved in cell wall biosynthesis